MDRNIERLLERFHDYYARRDSVTWPLCLVASRIVGRYERGVTQELADREGVSVSQIEHLAHAGSAYRLLRRYGAHLVRPHLRVSHFAAVWEAFSLSCHPERAQEAMVALFLALDPPDGKTRWTAQDIRDYAANKYPRGENPMRVLERLYSYVERKLPYDARERAIALLNELRDMLEAYHGEKDI